MNVLDALSALDIADLKLLMNYRGCTTVAELADSFGESFNMPSAEALWDKYGSELRIRFVEDSSAPKNADALPEAFFTNDPTPGKKAVEWLIRSYVNGSIKRFEDLSRARVALDDYYYLLGKRAITNKYMLRIDVFCGLAGCMLAGKEAPGLETFLQDPAYAPILQARDEKRGLAKKYHTRPDEYNQIYEDNLIRVIQPLTTNAACTFGAGTQWCTAATKGENMFEHYSKDGPMYIIEPKGQTTDRKEKYQFHPQSSQFMDSTDEPITTEFDEKYGDNMIRIPLLRDDYIEYIFNNNVYSSDERMLQLLKSLPELLPQLLSKLGEDETGEDETGEGDINNKMRMLLLAGIDPNVKVNNTYPIFKYIWDAPILQLLLESGADPNVYNDNEETPLHIYSDVSPTHVQLLLDADANPQLLNSIGETPLFFKGTSGEAISMDWYPLIARLLLDAGVDPNARSANGDTALFSEIPRNVEIIKILLSAGVDPNARNDNGETALFHLINNVEYDGKTYISSVRALLEGGADPNIPNNDGETILSVTMNSTSDLDSDTVKLLLEYGADPNTVTANGETLLDLLRKKQQRKFNDRGVIPKFTKDIEELLINAGAQSSIPPITRREKDAKPRIINKYSKYVIQYGKYLFMVNSNKDPTVIGKIIDPITVVPLNDEDRAVCEEAYFTCR